jgi:uncharacterized protein
MKDIVEFIVKQFVSNPDAVEVTEQQEDGYLNILLKVAPEDMGLAIGKSGQTIKAIRRLLTIKAISENMRVNLELIDSGVRPETAGQNDSDKSEDQVTGGSDEPDATEAASSPEETDETKTEESAS